MPSGTNSTFESRRESRVIPSSRCSQLGTGQACSLAALKKASGATVWAHEWEPDITPGIGHAEPATGDPIDILRRMIRAAAN